MAFKKEVVQFYLNVVTTSDETIKSKVGDPKVVISVENIREEFKLQTTFDLDVSSHSFN